MFSVIIPLYNKAKSIENTLNAVLAQTFKDYEVIIVNDGSTDESSDIVFNWILQRADNRFRLVNKANGGVSSARNTGILEAKYNYIAFLDADDYWYPDYLQEQCKMIQDFPDAKMWGINWVERCGGKDILLDTGLDENFRGYIRNYWRKNCTSDFFWSSTVVINREAFDLVGMFDDRIYYSEDLDMWYRIILRFPVAFNSSPHAVYMLDAENRALKHPIRLKHFLPYYIEKYEADCLKKKDFSHFIHTFAAVNILPYYMNKGDDFIAAKESIKHLRYGDIHWKYGLFFRIPYPLGKMFYKLMLMRK